MCAEVFVGVAYTVSFAYQALFIGYESPLRYELDMSARSVCASMVWIHRAASLCAVYSLYGYWT